MLLTDAENESLDSILQEAEVPTLNWGHWELHGTALERVLAAKIIALEKEVISLQDKTEFLLQENRSLKRRVYQGYE
jgi:hypothetical protein